MFNLPQEVKNRIARRVSLFSRARRLIKERKESLGTKPLDNLASHCRDGKICYMIVDFYESESIERYLKPRNRLSRPENEQKENPDNLNNLGVVEQQEQSQSAITEKSAARKSALNGKNRRRRELPTAEFYNKALEVADIKLIQKMETLNFLAISLKWLGKYELVEQRENP